MKFLSSPLQFLYYSGLALLKLTLQGCWQWQHDRMLLNVCVVTVGRNKKESLANRVLMHL